MAAKRKEVISSPQRQAKKPKRDAQAEKLNRQLREVMDALSMAPTTPAVEKMIESVLLPSLGEYHDQRHRFQEEVVESVQGLLGEAEAALRKEVADIRSQCDVAIGEKAQRQKEHDEAADKLKAKVDELQSVKVALAGKAMAFRSATQFLADAEESKNIDAKKSLEAEKKKCDFEGCLENLNFLKVALPEDAEALQKRDKLMALLTKYKFEESMIIALPTALAKVPDARGQFDLMAMTELDGVLAKLIMEQSEAISAAAPSREKCEAAVSAAQVHLTAVRAEQRAAAREFDIASDEMVARDAAAAESQKVLRNLSQLSKRLENSLNNAEVEVEVFQQGPLETFKELSQRVTPAPAAEEEVTAPAPMEEEQNVQGIQVPVAIC